MDLKRAIIENDVEAVEKILKKELADQPRDNGLWIKLCLTELQFPFEDHESALDCVNEINRFSDDDIDVLILEAGIKWHNMGFIDDGLFMRLSKVKTKNMSRMAIIFYF